MFCADKIYRGSVLVLIYNTKHKYYVVKLLRLRVDFVLSLSKEQQQQEQEEQEEQLLTKIYQKGVY